jgi:hypothetical protein
MATERSKKITPTWSDVKTKLADFDRAGMLALVQDMYAASKENQAFLHARFGLGADILKPYKTIIARWLWPDISRGQDTSISKAKKAIADYKKAVGRPEDLAELMTFYCEQAAGFSNEVGLADEGYFDSMVRMFAQVLKLAGGLPDVQCAGLLARLNQVRHVSHNFGYGVGDEMDDLLEEFQVQRRPLVSCADRSDLPVL